ncbi:A/G-specific adenine glycosylase [Buchnera aphidicola]|uniref:A/G-specific adenine glycosylase n=1 Tax=Buchnera aphidicola TaxID=9 RepID=UPI00346476AA
MKNWKFSQLIINWQHIFGRNNLPWQNTNNAYYTWISEIMLQQTKVNTVIPYFNKFITIFRDIKSISQTNLNHILYMWSGLGYYTRAINIYKTANIVVSKYHGKLPENIHLLIQLPGIGKTTAGAILSLTYNYSFPILDGNVKRILIRFYNINLKNKKTIIEKKLWHYINLLTPIHNAKKFNQGMMDLGTLICKPKKPKCSLCPIINSCKYKNINYYHKSKKIIYTKKYKFFIILRYQNEILLEHRKKHKIWNYLFCFPEFHSIRSMQLWLLENNINIKYYYLYNNIYHQFTQFTLKMIIINSILKIKKNNLKKKNHIWYNLKTIEKIGIPAPITKIIKILKNTIK